MAIFSLDDPPPEIKIVITNEKERKSWTTVITFLNEICNTDRAITNESYAEAVEPLSPSLFSEIF